MLRTLRFAVGLALVCSALPAGAQSKQECADVYVGAQIARREKRLREASEKLSLCASSACPAALRDDCTSWLRQVEAETPLITVHALDAAGATVSGTRVTIDGRQIAPGSAVRVETGDHVVHIEAPGMKPTDLPVAVVASQRRDIVLRLESITPSQPPRASVAAPVTFGALGLAGLSAFAALGVLGNHEKAELDARGCKGTPKGCDAGDVATIKALYVSADVSLAVGLASLVVAGVLVLTRPKGGPGSARVSWQPIAGGGGVGVRF